MHATLLLALLAAQPPGATKLGTLSFPITGSPECQQHFLEGMLALHSFEYEHAHQAFAAAAQADAGCAMAHWGDAMAYNHPIWDEEDQPAAVGALAQVKSEDKLTVKERAFLKAA